MKTLTPFLLFALFIASCGGNDHPAAGSTLVAGTSALNDTSGKIAAASSSPGTEASTGAHQMISGWEGTWTAEASSWSAANASPVQGAFHLTNKMILGKRFLQSLAKGTLGGKTLDEQSTLAYDGTKKQFIAASFCNLTAAPFIRYGYYDATTQSITFKSTQLNEATGSEEDLREVYKIIDPNFHVREIYTTASDGQEYKSLEIKYTRKR